MGVGQTGGVKGATPQTHADKSSSPGSVKQFNDALGQPADSKKSSKGEHTSEHSQDTSKSLPIVLATRPPINRGNPIGKQGAQSQGAGSKSSQTKAQPLATSKHDTHGILGEPDPNYDAGASDNDEGSYDVQIENPTGDTRLDARRNLRGAREAKFKDAQPESAEQTDQTSNASAANTRRTEGAAAANYQQSQSLSQANSAAPATPQPTQNAQAPYGGTQGATSARENMASNFQQVEDLGTRIANSQGPVTDADRTEWMQAQQTLRQSVTDYAGEISKLPPDSPDRAAAIAEMERLSAKLTAQELPVLARFDKGFGESWNHFHDKKPGSEGAVLQTRMKIYGITDEQMQRYITTGQEPAGLKKAVTEARRSGDWPALGVVRASYQMRADYLRATTGPDDVASRKQADQLDAASAGLTNNRNAIHMNWGAEKYSKLSRKYPDDTTRPANVQKQMDEAKQAVASVRSRVVDQVTAHPERYGKNSPTRQLAGDALTTEARITESEAKVKMEREAKANIDSTAEHNKTLKPDQPKVVPPPPKLHPDLTEGGAVDQKRTEAVKIDPSLGDVVHGGDRALQFHRETMNTKKLRLNINEQQVAHLNSKGQQPPAELVAKANTQVEDIFKRTLETNDKLTREKPGSLSVNQTRLLAELNGDATTYSAKIGNTYHQKNLIEMDSRLKTQDQQLIQRARDDLDKAYGAFEKAKRERIETEIQTKRAFGKISMKEYLEFQKDPAVYAGKQPDSAKEAKDRSDLDTAIAKGDEILASAKTDAAKAKQRLDYSNKIDDLDGLNTSPDMATGLAKDALARSEAHMKAIPESGPERLPRLQAAADHQSAVIGLSTVIRDNADARIARHALGHHEVESAYKNQPTPMIDDPVGRSADNLAKVTAEETETKRGALKDATNAVSEADRIRKDIGTELDKAQAKLPKAVQEQRAADVQTYKDTLAMQQVRSDGVVAQLAADIDPKAAREQLEQGSRIINDEMPYTHVSRTNKQQAAMQHSRNEIRAQALADHGDASLAVAERAQFTGGTEYGMLVVDALATTYKSADDLNNTLTIDGGGAAANTADKKFHEELTKRMAATVKNALEIDKSADVLKLADSIDNELAKDVGEFHKLQGDLGRDMKAQRGDAFGIFTNTVARLRGAIDGEGGDLNKIGLEVGNEYLRLGSGKGRAQAAALTRTAQALRDMHKAGIPDHVIMASLRDPRFSELYPKFFNKDTFEQARADNKKMFDEISGQIKGRYGVTLVDERFLGAAYGLRDTQLGKVFDSARSNRTDNIVTYLGNKNTDLLREGKAELMEYADMANHDWQKVAPYAAASQVVDQVVISMASGAALAGVFARAASLTRIPQAFSAARGLAVGMSAPARFAVLAGVNAGEAGLGMLTGAAMGKVGEEIFGEGSTGAKMFGYIGGGFQLSNASKVAMRSGLGFQAAMGLTLGGVPIVAQQLGASSDLAEKLGMASGIFIPTVLGTMSNRNTIKRAERVMVNELGLDPTKARGLMGDLFHAESAMDRRYVKDGAFDVEGFTRERAGKLVDQKFPGLNENARTQILDNATLDAARRRINMEPPKNGSVREQVQYIDEFHGRLESELVKMGVKSDRALELAQSEKTAMYDQALAATNAREKGAEGVPDGGGSDPNTPTGAGAATRHRVEELMRGTNQDVQLLNGKPSDLPLKLVAMDKANDRAFVKFPDGSMKQVKASEVVYVHEGQALGNLPPAVQKSFDDRFGKLSDDQKQQWNGMVEEAQKRSPEHVSVLRKMMAGGASMDEIRDMHQRTLNLSHEEIGRYFSPGNLPQHLEKSCVAACIQQIEGSLNPQAGHNLKDPAEQMRGQIDIMMRMDGGSEPRTDKAYPLDAPPLTDQKWVPARPYDWPDAMPPAFKNVLKQENHWDSYHKFDVNMQLDRRYLPQQLAEIASQGTAYINGMGKGGKQVVYELTGRRQGANGEEISVRTPGDKNETWWKKSDLAPGNEGLIFLPDGTVLTNVAVPSNQPLKAADQGLQLHQDKDIQNKIRAATGKELKQYAIQDGDAALRAIHDSVKEIGVAGVVVEWQGKKIEDSVSHQLLVKGAHDLGGGNYSFVVFEPWTGKTRTVSGEALRSRYTSGAPGGSEGRMKFVQVPDDMQVGGNPKGLSGGDAGDTMSMRKPGSGEGPKPSDATNVSGSKTGGTADIPDGGDTAKIRKVGGADTAEVKPSASSASGPAAGANAAAHTPVPAKSVDQIVEAYVKRRSPAEIKNGVTEADIARIKDEYKAELRKNGHAPETANQIADDISDNQYRRMAMAEDIYRHYNQPAAGKPQPKISEAQLREQLKYYDGPTDSPDGWHVRMNKTPPGQSADHSWVNADKAHPVDRFYVNVKAENAAEFADYVAGELNKKGIKFQLKVSSELKGYARADSGLVYTQGKDFETVRGVISKYRDLHPEAIAEGSPAFTKPMGKGIAIAEEPIQEGLPVVYHGAHSFGTARANLIAEAINEAPANASVAQVKALVRAKLQHAGFDPDRPWLAQGSKIDRYKGSDFDIARNSAPNGGAVFDDTVPQPPVRANPQEPPPGQGGPGGNGGESGGAGGGSNGSGGTGESSADIANQAAARQDAERVTNWGGPSQGGSVPIDSLLGDMQNGKLQVVDNAFNSRFHDQVWQDLTGKQGQAPAAYKIGNAVRIDLNRLTPEQLQRYAEYVRKQDAAKKGGPR